MTQKKEELVNKRLRVLLSAYACEPGKGSEPGVGWEWATRLAIHHDVTVLTRSNNREVIESALTSRQLDKNKEPEFIYVDLPHWFIRLKKVGWCPVFIYYLLWQVFAYRKVRGILHAFDIIHHVTFNGFRFPGVWWHTRKPVVLGPLGGGAIASSAYRRCFGWRWWVEKIREFSVRCWKFNPWTRASLRCASAVLVVGTELHDRFLSKGIRSEIMLETALPQELETIPQIHCDELKKNFIWVGNLEPWKAWQIAFEGYAQAVKNGLGDARLQVVGSGSQSEEAVQMAKNLNISDRVDFIGAIPRREAWAMISKSLALVFSSIRDTSGNVVLEAMGLSCPVICFNHQGVAMMTDDQCAIRVEPDSWKQSVEGFASAMLQLVNDPSKAEKMGSHGRMRALKYFSWDSKVRSMLEIYEEINNLYSSK